MTGLLAHRGPDARGTWVGREAGLAATRLAILDLSPAGNQPMGDPAGGVVVVLNGEIYNFLELRAQLMQAGYPFRSRSDTEVLLQGYRHWGESVLPRLRGMFAFAVWDGQRRRLFLARDRLGIKPLFFSERPDGLVFGSEIKAVLAHPAVGAEMDPAAVDEYLARGHVAAPRTIFRRVRAVLPGQWVRWGGGGLEAGRYWSPDFHQPVLEGTEDDLVDQLDAGLNDAVRSHLVSDVPVGVFLSGGIDSSLVAAIAKRQTDGPITTFTIGFAGGGDERVYARQVAAHIGSRHHERLAEPSLEAEVPRLVWHLEQPLFDNSVLPTHLVSQLAREHVKVVLSGDGGDEPFAGYDWTRWALILPSLPLPRVTRGWAWAYRTGTLGLLQRLGYDVSHSAEDRYLRRMTASRAFRHWLYTPEYSERIGREATDHDRLRRREAPVRDPREVFLQADLNGFLPDDILFKVDRMSMAHSLEVRVPLLDHRLLEWILRLPWGMRFRHGRGKYLLRRVAARYLPAAILKPRKQGFTVPVGEWLHGELGDLVRDLFASPAFAGRGIVRQDRALELLAMHRSGRYELGHRIWSLVILETWFRIWLDGQSPAQSLRGLLAESREVA
jgi:asparagine synthase (glutamine-hydrolysing)